MSLITALLPSPAQAAVINYGLIYWPGPVVRGTYLWSPHLGQWASPRSSGFPTSDDRALYKRPDVRTAFYRTQLRNLNSAQQYGQSNEARAIPGVYVPTSLANGYGGLIR